jgi:hypothetical protein
MERDVEGAVLDEDGPLAGIFDPSRDGVPVPRPPAQGLEDERVECTLEEVESGGHGVFFPGMDPGS